MLLFNSLSWPRTEVSEVEVQLPAPAQQIEVVDSAENQRRLNYSRSTSKLTARISCCCRIPLARIRNLFCAGATGAPAPTRC